MKTYLERVEELRDRIKSCDSQFALDLLNLEKKNLAKEIKERGCGLDWRGYGIHCGERSLIHLHMNRCPDCKKALGMCEE